MKAFDLDKENLKLSQIFSFARNEPVLLVADNGEEFIISKADDFKSDEEELTSLEIGKVYPRLIDPPSEKPGFVRVIDESGEDYLYPPSYFEPVHLIELAEQTIFAYLDSSRKENLESQEV